MSAVTPAETAAVAAEGNALVEPAPILDRARELGRVANLAFSGAVSPPDAWALFQTGAVKLVDVRTAEELTFVGRVPEAEHVPWATGTRLNRNPRFVRELEAKVSKSDVILLLCRSGKRSAEAAEAAARVGFTSVFNVLEGFEGDLNERQQRGRLGGWRQHDLPWIQD